MMKYCVMEAVMGKYEVGYLGCEKDKWMKTGRCDLD
jgi:hypothetical protein